MDVRMRCWVEAALGALAAVLAVVTAIVPDWIEEVFAVDPDAGSGVLEWGIVVVLLLSAIVLGAAARRDHARGPA